MADFTPLYTWTRDRLQKSEGDLPDSELEPDTQAVIDELAVAFPDCLDLLYPTQWPTDTAAQQRDRRAYEKAVGLIVAARRYPLETLVGSGEIKREQEGDHTYEYDIGSKSQTTKDERLLWLEEAAAAIARISCIAAQVTSAIANFSPFSTASPGDYVETGKYTYTGLLRSVAVTGGYARTLTTDPDSV